MDYRRLSDADLVDFSKNVEQQLTDHNVDGIDNTLADTLAATLTGLNAPFETSIEQSVQQTAEKQSVVAGKQATRDDLLAKLATVRNYLVAAESPKKAYEVCGFNFPKDRSAVVAADPTDLAASGTSNGVNRLVWNGNNKTGSVIYEIWRLQGDTEPFRLLGTTRKQVYIDTPVTPGSYYNYKVRAVAARSVSNFSNVAVVYGAI
jgi:fibronectin type 3 domain-containing protein